MPLWLSKLGILSFRPHPNMKILFGIEKLPHREFCFLLRQLLRLILCARNKMSAIVCFLVVIQILLDRTTERIFQFNKFTAICISAMLHCRTMENVQCYQKSWHGAQRKAGVKLVLRRKDTLRNKSNAMLRNMCQHKGDFQMINAVCILSVKITDIKMDFARN